MKVDKIIMSCDDTERYLKLWPYVSKICKLTLGITPVLFHITDKYSDFIHDEYGIVKKIKKDPDLPASFQAQIYRLYGTKFFKNETCLISDIDMLTFNRQYFLDQVKEYDENDFIIYIFDAYDLSREDCHGAWALNRIPMCYNLAKGRTFCELLNLDVDFNEFAERVYNFNFGYDFPIFHRDEIFLGKMIFRNLKRINIVKLNRGITDLFNINRRIEKNNFYDVDSSLIHNGHYVEAHIPGDWETNLEKFNQVINHILVYS